AAFARTRGVPTILSIRSGHFIDSCRASRAFRWMARRLLRIPTRLLCQGERWRQFFVDELGVPREKCFVLENWVASPSLLALGHQGEARTAASSVRILFMGWLERFKGVFELIEAASILRSRPPSSRFTIEIAGDGGEAGTLSQRIESEGLSAIVHLEGLVTGEAKSAALRAADIFVLPSHTEGLPNAMIEAMAAGLPVVVTPVGSVPDVVVDGHNGILVAPKDSARLADALRRLIDSPVVRESLGSAAHQTAKSRFTTEAAASAL